MILTILFFQAVAVFDLRFGPIGRAPYLYPFLDYPMYSRVHHEGEALTQYRVYAVLADSSEALVRPSDLGLSFWLYHNGLITGLRRGDAERVRAYARLYRERNGVRVEAFRLEDHPVVLTSDGFRDGSREPRSSSRRSCPPAAIASASRAIRARGFSNWLRSK